LHHIERVDATVHCGWVQAKAARLLKISPHHNRFAVLEAALPS
jgi:hypothetical protein